MLKKILRITGWLILDIIFVNMAYYSAYLIRFNGVIELPAFIPYLHLWPHISLVHLISFSIFNLYEHPSSKMAKKEIFLNTLKASIISSLASISIVYMMRRFWGFIPSLVFALALVFNVVLVWGWRAFVTYEDLPA